MRVWARVHLCIFLSCTYMHVYTYYVGIGNAPKLDAPLSAAN
jgi:hypothetical protein